MQTKLYAKNTRKAILSFLTEKVSFPVSVQDIYDELHKQGSSVNITTVYRQLEKLSLTGEVLQFLAEDGGTKLYQLNTHNCLGHLHVRCSVCGKVNHLDCLEVDSFLEHISAKHHVRINCNSSILTGVCESCCKST